MRRFNVKTATDDRQRQHSLADLLPGDVCGPCSREMSPERHKVVPRERGLCCWQARGLAGLAHCSHSGPPGKILLSCPFRRFRQVPTCSSPNLPSPALYLLGVLPATVGSPWRLWAGSVSSGVQLLPPVILTSCSFRPGTSRWAQVPVPLRSGLPLHSRVSWLFGLSISRYRKPQH